MKKIISLILIVISCLSITSCNKNTPSYLEYDSFFKSETLTKYHLDNLPQPKLDDSVLYNNDGKVLYLNLTEDEFLNYLNEVSNYILEKDNVYFKSLGYGVELAVGPLFIPMDVKVFIPLEDNKEFSKNGECFAFSLQDELHNGWITNSMSEVYQVNIKYQEGKLEDIDFEYTCFIEIGEVDYAKFETCAKEHKYNENFLSYPVPNTNIVIDIYYCEYCGNKEQSEYYGGTDTTSYSKVITKGAEYLDKECYQRYIVNPNCYAGLIEHIEIPKSDKYIYEVKVNGFSIPLVYEEDDNLVYGFIFPKCDVEIEVLLIEK